jgi:nucleoid-associated protein YgaU
VTRYVVIPGDTLTRIAAKHYGLGSRQYVNAIVDANRSVIADPDLLRAGMELVIPEVAGAVWRPTEPEPASAASRPEPVQWYQIAPNDRYITIAREQLGDGGRWREIFELNKDKFPDPGRIRPGVRIKLPPVHSAAGEARR